MGFLISGIVLLACLVGLFRLKNKLRNPFLVQLAYSDFTPRLMIVALGLIVVGLFVAWGQLFG